MIFHKALRIGTDCSGIEAPIVALQQMKIPFVHEFSSEIDKHCIETILLNFKPNIIFGDMQKRDLRDIPDIDMYVCGFPCQPFSYAGKRDGIRDPRGTVFWECLRIIRKKKPIIFVLENVKGLLSIDDGQTFQTMISLLKNIKIYNVHWKVLNTADYGIPQSRKRIFIVGIMKKHQKNDFHWPNPIPCQSLRDFIDWNDRSKSSKKPNPKLQKMNPLGIFLDLAFSFQYFRNADTICSCLCAYSNFWNHVLHRKMNTVEKLRLQGFPPDFRISDKMIQKQIGNSMSVNVLVLLFKSIFETLS